MKVVSIETIISKTKNQWLKDTIAYFDWHSYQDTYPPYTKDKKVSFQDIGQLVDEKRSGNYFIVRGKEVAIVDKQSMKLLQKMYKKESKQDTQP